MRPIINKLQQPAHIAPLVTFRIIFGAMMIFSTIRFLVLGWVDDHYLKPIFHFKYFGFEWVTVLSPVWMYVIHGVMILAAILITIGLFYRAAAIILFLTFTYTELIDLTYYLNHYYFVSLTCLLLIAAPANRYFSIDVFRKPESESSLVPRFWIFIFQLQLAIVYIYAGVAKINYDWLVAALPMKIWLPAHDKLPLIGELFRWKITPYIFSWAGMIYDCTIVFWLLNSKTRPWAYIAVIVFHLLTGLLFQIGVFPLVMIGATLIFFSESWHRRLLNRIRKAFSYSGMSTTNQNDSVSSAGPVSSLVLIMFSAYFLFQIAFPWRYLLYPGNLFWTEEGYRFSWRVMLAEKAGTATFYVKDSATGREGVVINSEFLNAHQEKQMAMQPDMVLQFAHFLARYYEKQGVASPAVRAEVYVTLNAHPSQLLIDPARDLTKINDGWAHKDWIMDYEKR